MFRFFRKRSLNRDLFCAGHGGHLDRVRQLLTEGADPNFTWGIYTVLGDAARTPKSDIRIVQLLLDHGADPNGKRPGKTLPPLLQASHASEDETIQLLLRAGAQLNVLHPRSPGATPLQELIRWASLETISLALDCGADPNMRSYGGWTALHPASWHGRVDVVRLLLERGVDPALRDYREQRTALDWVRWFREDPKGQRYDSLFRERLPEVQAILERVTPP